MWLENRGYLEARPQSGFYIRTPFAKLIPEPQAESLRIQPAVMGTDAVLEEAIRLANDPAFVPFGAGCASAELFPNRRLNLIARGILRKQPLHSGNYEFPPGIEASAVRSPGVRWPSAARWRRVTSSSPLGPSKPSIPRADAQGCVKLANTGS